MTITWWHMAKERRANHIHPPQRKITLAATRRASNVASLTCQRCDKRAKTIASQAALLDADGYRSDGRIFSMLNAVCRAVRSGHDAQQRSMKTGRHHTCRQHSWAKIVENKLASTALKTGGGRRRLRRRLTGWRRAASAISGRSKNNAPRVAPAPLRASAFCACSLRTQRAAAATFAQHISKA